MAHEDSDRDAVAAILRAWIPPHFSPEPAADSILATLAARGVSRENIDAAIREMDRQADIKIRALAERDAAQAEAAALREAIENLREWASGAVRFTATRLLSAEGVVDACDRALAGAAQQRQGEGT